MVYPIVLFGNLFERKLIKPDSTEQINKFNGRISNKNKINLIFFQLNFSSVDKLFVLIRFHVCNLLFNMVDLISMHDDSFKLVSWEKRLIYHLLQKTTILCAFWLGRERILILHVLIN